MFHRFRGCVPREEYPYEGHDILSTEEFTEPYNRIASEWQSYLREIWIIPSAALIVVGSVLVQLYSTDFIIEGLRLPILFMAFFFFQLPN